MLLTQELVMKCLANDDNRVWAVRTRAPGNIWLGELAAVLSLDENNVPPCSVSRTSQTLLLTRRSAAAQTKAQRVLLSRMESPPGTSLL